MKKINIFNQDIIVKDFYCSANIDKIVKSNPSLRLYIKITDSCNAKCEFCANSGNEDFGNIDLKKLEYVIRYLVNLNLLHGVSITGGEPMTNPKKLNDVLNLIWNIKDDMEVQISTNGLNLTEFKYFDQVNKLESIHISRHHYNDEINNAIFKANMPTGNEIMSLQEFLTDKKIININTIIMKLGINSLKEIKKMLDFVGRIGVYKNGFVALMKNNQFSIDNFINYNDIFNKLDESFFPAHRFYCKNYCECIDGLYLSKDNKIVEYYARMVKESTASNFTQQLVYTSNNILTKGFSKDLIYK